jgi:hypothetical protein
VSLAELRAPAIEYGNAEIRTSVSLHLRKYWPVPGPYRSTEILTVVSTEILTLQAARNKRGFIRTGNAQFLIGSQISLRESCEINVQDRKSLQRFCLTSVGSATIGFTKHEVVLLPVFRAMLRRYGRAGRESDSCYGDAY